jgi:ABC-type lipoprotein release transport system permease subunit
MNSWQYIFASLRHYRRVHLAAAAAVAVATAVITGALLVGDSMRGSLRDRALAGLGRIDAAVVAEQPLRGELAREWQSALAADGRAASVAPLLAMRGSATATVEGLTRRATGLEVLGVDDSFWQLGSAEPGAAKRGPLRGGVALVAEVAEELDASPGDFVVVRVPLAGSLPADSSLGEKEETVASRRMRVDAVLADDDAGGLARFALRPQQGSPRNVFMSRKALADLVESPGRANVLLAGGVGTVDGAALQQLLPKRLEDFGLQIKDVTIPSAQPQRFWSVTAEQLVLPRQAVDAVEQAAEDAAVQKVVAYLANTIRKGERRIPYSTIVGVDSTAELGPIRDAEGRPLLLNDDEVVLNDWAARELDAKPGDRVTITYYEPETTHGQLREAAPLVLTVRSVVPLADPDGRPTAAADPGFVPELPGVTDEKSISDWSLPFELVEEVRQVDEDYWDEHRTTPKAFVSHKLGERLWGARWGVDGVVRVSHKEGQSAEDFAKRIAERIDPAALGMSLRMVRQDAVRASAGTTPFDGLFLGFSFFLLAAAAMLAALVFRLSVEARAREVGLLAALGLSAKTMRWLLTAEGLLVAAAGSLVGVLLGVGYARTMVHGLTTWWVDATAAPFLRLHVTPRSLAFGFAAGLCAALGAILWSLRGLLRLPPRQLLAGDAEPALDVRGVARWTKLWAPVACLVAALGSGLAATKVQGEARAGAFFGAGALAMIAALLVVRGRLRQAKIKSTQRFTLGGLALASARRNPARSLLALALTAAASFLLLAIGAFRLAPAESGTGGYQLLGTSDLPLLFDPGTEEGRRQLGLPDDVGKSSAEPLVGFRVRDGEDASCLNLYQTAQPRVLGVDPRRLADSAFAWGPVSQTAAPSEVTSDEKSFQAPAAPWRLLNDDLGVDDAGRPIIPMILDRNTAMYSLKLFAPGDRLSIRDSAGRATTLEVVAMLANSVLQGDVVVSEANFLKLYPEVAGQRFFLIRTSAPDLSRAAAQWEQQLEDYGFDAEPSRSRLAALLAVQNTYLSTFQSLGALGLLLGTAGLAAAQWRSAAERRGELALLQATGYAAPRLVRLLQWENLSLLAGGLAIGCGAALAAVVPQAALEGTSVPWLTFLALTAAVGATGALAGRWVSRRVLKTPLLPALRGE